MEPSVPFQDRLARLSPEKRRLVELRLKGAPSKPPESETIARRPRGAAAPLSFGQEQLWFLDRVNPGNPFYIVPMALRLLGRLSIPTLSQALQEIVGRHEILRTTFELEEGRPLQRVSHSPPRLATPLVDLSGLQADSRDREAERLAREEAHRPFDLGRLPLLRMALLRFAKEDHVVLLTIHHIVSDSWSMSVFVSELSALYAALLRGRPSPLGELPIQFGDFALWQRRTTSSDVLRSHLQYWKRQLTSAHSVLELPLDRPRPTLQRYRGRLLRFRIESELTKQLKSLSQRRSASFFMTLLSCLGTLLHRYSGQEDIVIGSGIANRHRREIEPLIGFIVNTMPLRLDMSGNPTFEELLDRARRVCLDAHAHQDVPFEHLVKTIRPERNLSYNPFFQVMFVLLNAPMSDLDLPGLRLEPWQVDTRTAVFDLTYWLEDGPEGLDCKLQYNTDLFNASTISRTIDHFQRLLEEIAARPEQRLLDIPLDSVESESKSGQGLHSEDESEEFQFLDSPVGMGS